MDDKKIIFPVKICLGEELLPPLVKVKNQHQNFENYLKQKRCVFRHLILSRLFNFEKI